MALTEYGVAYRNPSGKDYFGEPWVLPGLQTEQDAIRAADNLKLVRCLDVTIFMMPKGNNSDIKPPHITWDYVAANTVDANFSARHTHSFLREKTLYGSNTDKF